METKNKILFAKHLKECRKYAKISQEELAFSVGLVGGSSISQYEDEERKDIFPPKERLDNIVNTLRGKGVSDDLLEKLYIFCGYSELEYSNPYTERVNKLLEGSHRETKELLEFALNLILEPLERYQIGLTYTRRGEIEPAQSIFRKLLPDTLDPFPFQQWLRLHLLVSSADAQRLQGNLSVAIGILKDAEKIARDFGKQGQKTLASMLLLRGKIYRRLSKWQNAKDDFNNAIQAFREHEMDASTNQDSALALVERKLAGTHLFQGQPKDALEHIDRSLKICNDLSDINGEIKGLQHRAWAIALLGQVNDALKIHKNIVGNADLNNVDLITRAKGARFLGDSYKMCGIPHKAIESYEKAITHLDQFFSGKAEKKDVLVYGTIDLGRGSSYRLLDDYIKAEKYLIQSLATHTKIGAKYHEALTHREFGKLMLAKGDLPRAEKELVNAKKIFVDLENEYYLIGLSRDLAGLELRRGNYPKARSLASSASKHASDHSFPSHYIMSQIIMAKVDLAHSTDHNPFSLFTSAFQLAVEVDPYLVYEALCRITEQPYFLNSEKDLKPETLRLCRMIAEKENELLDTVFPRESVLNWLEEVEHFRTQLENELAKKEFSTGRAVLVGIGAYKKMRPLTKTTVDAQDLHDLLVRSGYPASHISLLLDKEATKANINNSLDNLARHAKSTDTVVVFFSGHGARMPGGFDPGEYICPIEADQGDLKSTAISNDELTNAIKSIPAKQVIVFLDACHSGGVGEPKNSDIGIKTGLSEATYSGLAAGEGRVVIASCGPDEFSWELPDMRNGLFSHYLLKGLGGDASDSDGTVRVFGLSKYVSENVPRHKPQHPFIKIATNQDFPVIK